MSFYLLGLGSNIDPHRHLQQVQQPLAELGPLLEQSAVLETQAEGDNFSGTFCNQLVILRCELPPTLLKQKLQRIEVQLGREPKNPARKHKDRTIDIDILGRADSIEHCRQLPLEDDYYQQVQRQWLEKVCS
ncbi:2-amino-4-hydroxy-6-hydroxymethyldihydropteridine diphosphokinase [Bacterioplanes sanyensis]|uniref:2-amino-4-hydroxy-6-hydroxymethyldihydropteridine diphosphokinase n=1 Tax=Bacterioplanes sanyensis TaxID=1249553 RepID=A0A222FQ00_9GAMM|nr:2-amino-4-hydroxy-6-hydroxymethyldihydropteridine diphosphokinase [Bacterioplanes sanyensis]ASP40323.1 2-amino-4-hydroxy-6-hydroxymethyldihydropteridine diphosphokinase [Bacterioplanes sanyensis]